MVDTYRLLWGFWCWERLKAEGEGADRGWDGWMASPIQWTWVWVNSAIWRWTGRPGVLQSIGSQRVGHNWVTELSWAVGLLIATDGSPKIQKTQVRSHRMSFKSVWLFLKVCAQSDGLSCWTEEMCKDLSVHHQFSFRSNYSSCQLIHLISNLKCLGQCIHERSRNRC